MSEWDHLAVVVEANCMPYQVRLVENKELGLLFPSCAATKQCIDKWSVLSPYGWGGSRTETWRCYICQTIVNTAYATNPTLEKEKYYGIDGAQWVAAWLGLINYDDVQITQLP